MKSLVAQSITIYLDLPQDRLNLLFLDARQQRLTAVMTRRLFKSWLRLLPDWLRQHSPHADSQFCREIEQLQHQQAQQSVSVAENQVSLELPSQIFLVETLNMTLLANESLRMSFVDADQQHQALLVLSSQELHRLVAEMLVKVADWDLANPWKPEGMEQPLAAGLRALH